MAYASCKDTSDTQAPSSSVSAIGLIAVLLPMPVCAITSASVRSFLAVPGKHPPGVLHGLSRKVSNIDPFRAPPVLPAADRDGATRFQAHCPEEWPPDIYPEIEALRPELVFLLAFHGGTFLAVQRV